MSTAQPSNCSTGDLRLRGGSTQYEGRIEMCYNGLWGSVCQSSFSQEEARVVCNQLGYQSNEKLKVLFLIFYIFFLFSGFAVRASPTQFGPSRLPVFTLAARCTRSHTSNLTSCAQKTVPGSFCYSYNEAGVTCEGRDTCYLKIIFTIINTSSLH